MNTFCDAAYGSNATHQMTEEALADRQAALHGDAGTDESFQVDIPPKQPTDQVWFLTECHMSSPGPSCSAAYGFVEPMLHS